MTRHSSHSFRVLFLCTRNAARSQLAEALMTHKAERAVPGRFVVASAGSEPASVVHPMTIRVLREAGIDWSNRRPRSIEAVLDQPWDLIITVCDRAKETCPVLPGQPIYAHWGMDDPADVEGEMEQQRAFHDALSSLGRRIDLLLSLPIDKLERIALEARVRAIADDVRVLNSA